MATITVTRAGSSSNGHALVVYATASGTATGGATCGGGAVYVTTTGSLSWADTIADKTFTITICPETLFENETLTLTLSNATGQKDGQEDELRGLVSRSTMQHYCRQQKNRRQNMLVHFIRTPARRFLQHRSSFMANFTVWRVPCLQKKFECVNGNRNRFWS